MAVIKASMRALITAKPEVAVEDPVHVGDVALLALVEAEAFEAAGEGQNGCTNLTSVTIGRPRSTAEAEPARSSP